ncbi:MAG: hypothetical protein LBK95_16010, partial [Bifidobacteriaceae bacterium]|jgi:glycosyltransferase involved in cell wall biosynthesis|nr:hypothetical protein [Bifidobacteriaceae bacterium]
MEYRDAWLLDVFTGRQAYSDRSRPARLERRFIAAAAQTWFINQDILDWHAARYPAVADRFRLVPNGWDPELLGLNLDDAAGSDHPDGPGSDGSGSDGPGSAGPGCGQPGSARSGSDRHGSVGVGPGGLAAIGSRGQPLTFGYLGTISANAPMPEVVAGWRAAKAAGLLPPDSVLKLGGYLGYFGGSPDPSRDPVAAAVLGAEADGVEYVGPVDKAAVGAFYGSLDALVLPIKAGRYVTSGKVYEYIATGKPIVSIHPPEAGASRVLEGYPLWAPVADMTADQAATAFGKGADLVRGLTPELTAEALAFGERFTRQRQLGPAIDGLANLLPR